MEFTKDFTIPIRVSCPIRCIKSINQLGKNTQGWLHSNRAIGRGGMMSGTNMTEEVKKNLIPDTQGSLTVMTWLDAEVMYKYMKLMNKILYTTDPLIGEEHGNHREA